ncbi:MAG TPA: M20/M25/M40 family metallo-hydrolase [Candidatus Aminicenantes bacterium]|nr:M20/M25/M40 family metallo-hydrolase [Candidatus Aminicenantes bacterium]HRY63875.1 M20/M25/M40 family metallo-hydrolase [Candidatus Aminicenantes bacterium]HRZ70788.1 M20/M25/M40 family metallo-hydrolase [Candidatus Aminicenantes bacterium]
MKRHPIVRSLVLALLAVLLSMGAFAQEKLDLQMLDRIRAEGLNNSKIGDFLIYLCDIYGPRLPDSPQYVKAGEWVVGQAKEIGLANAAMEPYGTFGRSWELLKFYAAMTEPQYMPIIGYPKAWTPGTNGLIKGPAVLIQAKTVADLDKYKGKLKDAIVLVQEEQDLPISFDPMASRLSGADLDKLGLAPEPYARRPQAPQMQDRVSRAQVQQAIQKMFKAEGVGVVIDPGRGKFGTVFVASGGSRARGTETPVPAIAIATEQYNRIVRILQKNVPVTLEVEVQARFTADDLPGTNVVAEIPGADPRLKTELVMLGGHFDTWHGGTGATDDGAGCAVAFEAMRILKALGVQPRRTIRMAFWDAEEQGFVGSRGYVANHFFDRAKKEKKPEYDKLSAYFNFDNGSGKIRGIYAQGNSAVVPIFEEWLEPVRDLGAGTVVLRNTGGTDHLPFDGVGLPGFQFIQDDLEYDTLTHHSTMDVYDHLSRPDLMQAATVMAWFVYNAAMRDQKLPRKYFDANVPAPQRGRN